MNEEDPGLAALAGLSTTMRRGRFKDALPEEEQREITLILTPSGVEVVSDTGADGADEPDADDMVSPEGEEEDAV